MNRRTRWILALTVAIPVTAVGTGIGIAAVGDDENDRALRGETLERARGAALRHTGDGRVTDTEADDDDSAYEVEVTLPDGTRVDVQLDKDFNVVGSSQDHNENDPDDADEPGDHDDRRDD
jgi:uncharacterized membrane protein YkoI